MIGWQSRKETIYHLSSPSTCAAFVLPPTALTCCSLFLPISERATTSDLVLTAR